MERAEVLKKVNDVFRDVLDNDEIVLKDETTADDVEGWDSLSHIQIIDSLEKFYNIRFSSNEILNWDNIGGMVDSIVTKI